MLVGGGASGRSEKQHNEKSGDGKAHDLSLLT
jgi:hypothetical protein